MIGLDYMGTEIRTFHSLREFEEALEEQIEIYKTLIEDYSQWLGSFLRDYEEIYGEEEWFKNLGALQKSLKIERKAKPSKKKEKGKKKGGKISQIWVQFKELALCASDQGEAEILFEAIEKLKEKVDKLEKIRLVIEDLERAGLGKDIAYLTYICDGIPEKIVLKHKEGTKFEEKFKFIADFKAVESLGV